MEDYNEAVIFASGEVLTEHLPNDWFEWSDDKLNEFLEDKVSGAFECFEAEGLWNEIDKIADGLLRFETDSKSDYGMLVSENKIMAKFIESQGFNVDEIIFNNGKI